MTRTYAFQVDDETSARIELDRAAVQRAVGQEVTPSAYFRIVMGDRLRALHGQTAGPSEYDGFREGLRRGFSVALKRFQAALSELSQASEVAMEDLEAEADRDDG